MRTVKSPLVALLATALTLGSVTVATPAAAATTDTLAVDFSQPTGAFRGGASGTLYGLGDEGAPTQALINGAHITNSSQKAPFGTQHPSGDSLKVEDNLFAKTGTEMDIYVQDYYPDWAYNGGQRPGDTRTYNQATGTYTNTPNGIWDYLEVVEFVTEAVATKSDHPEKYLFIPFNEPDGGNWYSNWEFFNSTFLPDWTAAYNKIQEVWARHGLGHARIGGPGDAAWRPDRSAVYLDHAKATNTLPDVFIWHELGIDNLATYRGHLAEYRALETARGISPRAINITEFGMLRDMGVPGQLIQWFSMFEDTKVDAQSAYWNYAGNLNDNSARPNGANGGWWMYKWYGDLQGSNTVKVTPPQLNAVDTLQGIGALDADNRRATVLYGGSAADQVTLNLSGLDASFGTNVDVEVRETPLTGAEGLADTPRLVAAFDGLAVSGGAATVTVPNHGRYAGYQLIVTPNQGRTVTTDQTWSTTVEAENTAVSGASVFDESPTAGGGWQFMASGSKVVGAFNNTGSKADWTVTVPRAGTYRYQVIGATPGIPGRHALFVDGVKTGIVQYTADLALNATSKWKYRGSAELNVTLPAGTHTLSLRASENGTSVLPNADITLDRFTLTDITDGERTVYPASTLRLFDGATLNWATGATRGSAAISGTQRADVYVTAFDSGYYDVALDYATSGASTVELTVNGRKVTTVAAPSGRAWTSTARMHLAQGINEIEVRSPEGALLQQLSTTRAKAGDAAAVRIEAESGTRSGAAAIQTVAASSGSNVSNGADVGYLGNGAANTVSIARQAGFNTPGQYDVVVAYANAETIGRHDYNPQVVDRPLEVTEAGAGLVGKGYFRYTYAWNSYWEKTIPVTLTTADAPLVFGSATGYAPNVDYVIVAPVVTGTPTTVAASVAAPVVSTTVSPATADGANGWYVTAPSVSAAAATDDGSTATLEHRIGAGAWTAGFGPVVVSGQGSQAVSFRATDAGGRVSETATTTVKVDTVKPTATATPAGRTVTVAAADATSGVAGVEYQLDGGPWTPYTAPVVVNDQAHTVTARSTDNAGLVSDVATVAVAAAPVADKATVTVTSNAAPTADGWYNQLVLVSLQVPTGSKAQYRINGAGWVTYSKAFAISTSRINTVDTRLLRSGAAVTGSESATTVKIDTKAPVSVLTRTPASGSGSPRNPITMSFNATDAVSGVARTEYQVNGGSWAAVTGPLVVDRTGTYLLSYRSVDTAGNVESIRTTTVQINADTTTTVKATTARVAAGGYVTFTLAGYDRYDLVHIALSGAEIGTVGTDVNGAARITLKVPTGTVPGTKTVTATGSDGGPSASSTLTVTG